MSHKPADDFFNDLDFVSIVNNIKGIMTSDGSMSILLDFERVLDAADLYATKNWLLGELVKGPEVGRYNVKCMFMWPEKLMPDPRGAKRLVNIGGKVKYATTEVKVPIQVKNYDDFVPGTNYPKMVKSKVWLVEITLPIRLLDDIKTGSMDLANQEIDLSELQDNYKEDFDKTSENQETDTSTTTDEVAAGNMSTPDLGAAGGMPAAPGAPPL